MCLYQLGFFLKMQYRSLCWTYSRICPFASIVSMDAFHNCETEIAVSNFLMSQMFNVLHTKCKDNTYSCYKNIFGFRASKIISKSYPKSILSFPAARQFWFYWCVYAHIFNSSNLSSVHPDARQKAQQWRDMMQIVETKHAKDDMMIEFLI